MKWYKTLISNFVLSCAVHTLRRGVLYFQDAVTSHGTAVGVISVTLTSEVKVNQSRYRPGVAQRVPGS